MNNRKKLQLFLLMLLLACSSFSQTNHYDSTHLYTVAQLQKDFRFLRTNLEKTHPNLYLYTSKVAFSLFFDSLYKSIRKPLTVMQFYNSITLLNSKLKDGHTMFLPDETTLHYFNAGKFLPLYIFIANNRLYIRMNCSDDSTIKEAAEIVSINNISSADILNQLLARQIRDGNNPGYAVWILTNYFKEYFGFLFGHPASYSITFKKANNAESQNKTIRALSKDSISFYKQRNYPRITAKEKQGIVLEMNQPLSTAMLTIPSFDIDVLKSVYSQNFKSIIKKMFAEMHNHHIDNLILDVRNNQGGDFETGRLLLSYLLLQPLQYLANSNEYKNIIPVKNNYKGKLYMLINGGSFSNTAIVSSYLQLTKRGIFIGEETGGNENIISGDAIDFVLPETSIQAEISTKKYVIKTFKNDGHGVIPDYFIHSTIDDIITGKDTAKEFAFNLISKKK